MDWNHGEDIGSAHAFLSLEEVRNRRVSVQEGDHVQYDDSGRYADNHTRLHSYIFSSSQGSDCPTAKKLNFRFGKGIKNVKIQVVGLVDCAVKYGGETVKSTGRFASCFKSYIITEASSCFNPKGVRIRSGLMAKNSGNAPPLKDVPLVPAQISRNDSDLGQKANEEKLIERVKSKLPSQEPVPSVESGFVKRAIQSYKFNVLNEGKAESSVNVDTGLEKTSDSSSPGLRDYSFSEHVEHSVLSSQSELPASEVRVKEMTANSKKEHESRIQVSDDFKNGFVARIAESLDYFIDHEQHESLHSLRPISPMST